MSRVYLSLVVVLTVVLAGCKNDSESAISTAIDKMKEMTSILKGVKDKDSAAAAKSKLEALGKDMEATMTKLDKKENLEEMNKAREKYKTEFEAAMKDFIGEMARISQIPGAGNAMGGPMGGFGGFGGPKFK